MNVLVTGAWEGYGDCKEQLEKEGLSVCFMQWEKDALPCAPDWPRIIVCNGLFLSHPIEQFTNLKLIQLTSAGTDRVPMDYAKAHGIRVMNASDVYCTPMAEHAVCSVLSLYRRMPAFYGNQKEHKWEKQREMRELTGSTVCILGCGNLGTACAKRFRALGCKVYGIDIVVWANPCFDEVRGISEFDKTLAAADILIICVPLTEQTVKLVNRERLSQLKPGAAVVNISRGAVLDCDALAELKSTTRPDLLAVLDVFENEPLAADSPLWDMPQVIITPHNSYVGNGNRERLNRVITENLGEIFG